MYIRVINQNFTYTAPLSACHRELACFLQNSETRIPTTMVLLKYSPHTRLQCRCPSHRAYSLQSPPGSPSYPHCLTAKAPLSSSITAALTTGTAFQHLPSTTDSCGSPLGH